ncbi:MAG: YncE family protein [Rhodanobacteraceae bacterium]
MKIIALAAGCGALVAALGATALAAPSASSGPGWHVVRRYLIGGSGGWDYLAIDQRAQRLYVSRSDRVLVLDATDGRRVGEIEGLSGAHGIALADTLHRGFISNGRANTVTVFDPATLKVEQTVAVGAHDPDGIVYDPYSRRVFTFNGGSNNTSVIDATTGKLVGHIALPGQPEFPVSDGHGHVFDNIESGNELVVIDPLAMKVTAVWPLKDCRHPSGLAIDPAHHRLFSVCQNSIMAVTDSTDGKAIASVPIGEGPDAVEFDAKHELIFSSNGRSGTLTVVHEDNAGHFRVLANVPTQTSARTMALDQLTGRVFLSAAEFGPRPKPTAADPHPRPPVKPGSFRILSVARTTQH